MRASRSAGWKISSTAWTGSRIARIACRYPRRLPACFTRCGTISPLCGPDLKRNRWRYVPTSRPGSSVPDPKKSVGVSISPRLVRRLDGSRGKSTLTTESDMRYISFFTHEKKENVPPTQAEMAAMGKLIEDGMKSGWLIATEGVQFRQEGVRIHKERGGDISVTDGPFTEAKEVVGGYALMRASSKAEVVE